MVVPVFLAGIIALWQKHKDLLTPNPNPMTA